MDAAPADRSPSPGRRRGARVRDAVAKPLRADVAGLVVSFFMSRLAAGTPTFTMPELERAVRKTVRRVTSESIGRILRRARADKRLQYALVSRNLSTYRIVGVDSVVAMRAKTPVEPPADRRSSKQRRGDERQIVMFG